MVELPLVMEEHWSSANFFRNFLRQKKVVCMKSEMQILRFYLVRQNWHNLSLTPKVVSTVKYYNDSTLMICIYNGVCIPGSRKNNISVWLVVIAIVITMYMYGRDKKMNIFILCKSNWKHFQHNNLINTYNYVI